VAFTRDDRKERAFTVQEVKTFRDAYTHPLTPGMPEEAKLPGEAQVSAPPPPRQAR
jgi:hypothetical protein